MTMIKICGIVILCLVSVIILRNIKSDYTYLPAIAGMIIILFVLFSGNVSSMFSSVKEVSEETGIGEYVVVLFKALGISYLAIITSDICRSSGEEMLANAAQTAGKLEILSLSFPLAMQLIEAAKEML